MVKVDKKQCIRKQEAFKQREALILNAAQNMIHLHGYSYLTMDRIAEKVGYSKGTIYNHFANKEDLVGALCCSCQNNVHDLFKRATQYTGSTRERFSAIMISYALYIQLYPLESQNIQIVKNNIVREKISLSMLNQLEQNEQIITKITTDVVQQAINCGELEKKHEADIGNIAFGCWSMVYGAMLLEQSGIPLGKLGFNPVLKMLWHNINILLDGFNWRPTSGTLNTDKLYTELSAFLFEDRLTP